MPGRTSRGSANVQAALAQQAGGGRSRDIFNRPGGLFQAQDWDSTSGSGAEQCEAERLDFGDWDAVAQTQGNMELPQVLRLGEGEVAAVQVRDSLAEPWRRVFVMPKPAGTRSRDHVLVYDSFSRLIDHPGKEISNGSLAVSTLRSKLNILYRLPVLRPQPRSRHQPASPGVSEVVHIDASASATSSAAVDGTRNRPVNVGEVASAGAKRRAATPKPTPKPAVCSRPGKLVDYNNSDSESSSSHESEGGGWDGAVVGQPPPVRRRLVAGHDAVSLAGCGDGDGAAARGGDGDGAAARDGDGDGAADDIERFETSARVQLQVSSKQCAGLVAENGDGFITIALDKCAWHRISHAEAKSAGLRAAPDEFIADGATACSGVVSLSISDSMDQPVVTGMLTGIHGQTLLKGQVSSYFGHYAKPIWPSETPRTRRRVRKTYCETSFACGDVVSWRGDSTNSTRAAVMRILYKQRASTNRSDQSRKLLVLAELFDPAHPPPKPRDPIIFPASWRNWERLPAFEDGWHDSNADAIDANALTVTEEALLELEQVPLPSLFVFVLPWWSQYCACNVCVIGAAKDATEDRRHDHPLNGSQDCWGGQNSVGARTGNS